MGDIISSISAFTEGIVASAQPNWDGGIISFMMNEVLFVNASNKSSPTEHLFETIGRGGYLAGLVCGIIWATLLLIVGIGLCVFHFRRKSTTSKATIMYTMLANRIQYKRASMEQSWLSQAMQFILSDLFILIAIVMCTLAIVVNAHLNSALTSTKNEDAVIPRFSRSVKNVQNFVNLLTPHARQATEPIVDEIVYDTELLQNKTREKFSKALTKKMKGDVLQTNGLLLVDYFTALYNSMEIIYTSQDKLSKMPFEANFVKVRKKVNECCTILKNSDKSVLLCDSIVAYLDSMRKKTGGRYMNINFTKIMAVKQPKTLTTLLSSYGQTPAKMRQLMEVTLKKKKAMEDRLYVKSKKVMKVSESIRNMTSGQWDDLEKKLVPLSAKLDNVSDLVNDKVHPKVAKYERIRNVIYLLVLLIMMLICLFCSIIFIHHICVPGQLTRRLRNTSKVSLYASMMILSLAVIVCMGTFLLGGYSQTEICRYLREVPQKKGNTSKLHLDRIINNWLDKHWTTIEKSMGNSSSMPLPRPKDIFYGIQTSCKANKSIMSAINAMDTFDVSAISKPDMTLRFLRIGRELMHESFRKTKPEDLLRPNMTKDLNDLSLMVKKLILVPDYDDLLNELNRPLTLIDVGYVSKQLSSLKENILKRNLIKAYGPVIIADNSLEEVKNDLNSSKIEIERMRMALVTLLNHKNITNIIKPMYPAIRVLKSYVTNKTKWISEADQLYDEVVVKSTMRNSPKLMAESTVRIMSVLGPCRYLYDAFRNAIVASCVTVVQPLNLMWLFMGCSLFFLTPSIVIALLILTKEMTDPKSDLPTSNGIPVSGDGEKYELNNFTQRPFEVPS